MGIMGTRLQDKVAVITGGSGGIGRACSARFTAEGAAVVLVDLDEQCSAALKGCCRPGKRLFATGSDRHF